MTATKETDNEIEEEIKASTLIVESYSVTPTNMLSQHGIVVDNVETFDASDQITSDLDVLMNDDIADNSPTHAGGPDVSGFTTLLIAKESLCLGDVDSFSEMTQPDESQLLQPHGAEETASLGAVEPASGDVPAAVMVMPSEAEPDSASSGVLTSVVADLSTISNQKEKA